MNVRKITPEAFAHAFVEMNKRYDNNIEFRTFDTEGTGFVFTIKARDPRGPGSALSASWNRLKDGSRRRTGAACWHAHGWLFEEILKESPTSWITTMTGKIDINGGNWRDWNRGSPMAPAMASNLCECE